MRYGKYRVGQYTALARQCEQFLLQYIAVCINNIDDTALYWESLFMTASYTGMPGACSFFSAEYLDPAKTRQYTIPFVSKGLALGAAFASMGRFGI